MTLSEFKAWFEGYTEGLEGAPNEKQFARIKEQVAKIDGAPISRTVFIDRYRHYDWNLYWYSQPFLTGSSGSLPQMTASYSANTAKPFDNVPMTGSMAMLTEDKAFDSHLAMRAVGAAEALLDA